MKRTVRDNINAAYSLHDMNVISFETKENDIIMKTQSGMIKTTPICTQTDGYVEFHDVRWDFSYVYLLGVTGNIGAFTGEKMFLKDFIERYKQFGLSILLFFMEWQQISRRFSGRGLVVPSLFLSEFLQEYITNSIN